MKKKISLIFFAALITALLFALASCGGTEQRPEACEHNWQTHIEREAGCDYAGDMLVYCELCGENRLESISPLGHDIVTVNGTEPTCTETGLTSGEFCNRCNQTIKAQETIVPKGHTEVTDEGYLPTCTANGLSDGKHCSVCNTVLVEQTVITTSGHSWQTQSGKQPTCTEAGLTEGKICTVCKHVEVQQQVIAALGHAETVDAGYAAGCLTEGLTDGKHCTVCGTVTVEPTVIAAAGHKIVKETGTAASCQSAGVSGKIYCSGCNIVFEESFKIEKLGHKLENGTCIYCQITCSQGLAFAEKGSSAYEITGIGECQDTTLIIPGEYNGKPVVGIASGAFSGAVSITDVIVVGNIEYIADGAFSGCTSLKSVKLPGSVKAVGNSVFDGCSALKEIICEDFSQMNGWAPNYPGSATPSVLAEKYNGLTPYELYYLALERVNQNLDSYISAEQRELFINKGEVYNSFDATTQLMFDSMQMQIGNYVEYAGKDFYVFQFETTNDIDYATGKLVPTTVGSKNWYYNGYIWQSQFVNETQKLANKVKAGGEYIRELLAESNKGMPAFSENFFKNVKFYRNTDGSFTLIVDVSGEAMTEFLLTSAGSYVEDFKDYRFAYTKVLYTYNFDSNGNISDAHCDAGFTFGGGIDGTIIIEQLFSQVGTLESIVTVPTGNFNDGSYPYECGHHSTKTVPGYEATCDAPGLSDGVYCKSCLADVTVSSVIPAKNHNIQNNICTNCGIKSGYSMGLSYDYNADGKTATLIGIGNCQDENIIIPAEIYGIVINKIASGAFKNAKNAVSVTVPASVTEIAEGAFDGSKITKYTLPINLIKYVPKTAVEIEISTSTEAITIPAASFENFKSLTTLTIPSAVEAIEEGAFVGCDRLFIIRNYSSLELEMGSDTHGAVAKNAITILGYGQESDIFVEGDYVFKLVKNSVIEDYYLIRYLGSDENLVLPNGFRGNVYTIADNVFSGISTIKTIEAGDKVKANINAFSGCTSQIVSAKGSATVIKALPNASLQYVEVLHGAMTDEFLKEAPELREAYISATFFGSHILYGCPKLEKVTVNGNTTSISNYFLGNCTALKSITITGSIADAGWYTLDGVTGVDLYVPDMLTMFYIGDAGSLWLAIKDVYVDGVVTRTLSAPYGVTKIQNGAFENCRSVDKVVLSDSVDTIGSYAFSSSAIKTVETGSTLMVIEASAFEDSVIESLYLPDGFREISWDAFKNAHALKQINFPEGMTTISSNAFYGATSLTEVNIPSSVENLRGSAFLGAKSLRSVTVGAKTIGTNAFAQCPSLVNVTLLDSVKTIDSRAFYSSDKITNLSLGGVEEIGDEAFFGVSHIKSLVLPETLKKIGEYAFTNANISSITLPASLEEMHDCSFYNCKKLIEVLNKSSIDISTGEYTITDNAVRIASGEDVESVIYYKDECGFIFIEAGNPKNYEEGYYLVDYVGSAKEFTLPADYEGNSYNIGKNAFYGSDFVSVTLSDGVRDILEGAFNACPNILSLTVGANVESIHTNAFLSSSKLVELICSETFANNYNKNTFRTVDIAHQGPTKIEYVSDFAFYTTVEGKPYVMGYVGDSDELVLPADYKGAAYHVYNYAFADVNASKIILPENIISVGTSIAYTSKLNCPVYEGVSYIGSASNPYLVAMSYEYNSDVKNLVLHPDTVIIAPFVFDYATSLETVDFGNKLRYIGNNAFCEASELKAINLPDTVEYIGVAAFEHCYAVSELYLGTALKTIDNRAFSSIAVKEITIPENVIYLGEDAFAYIQELEKLTYNAKAIEFFSSWGVFECEGRETAITVIIGDGVTKIPDGLCDEFENLASISVADMNDLVYIGSNAFSRKAEWISTLELPSLEYIGYHAFANAENLKSIKLGDNVTIDEDAFKNCTALETIELSANTEFPGHSNIHGTGSVFEGCTTVKSVKLSLATKTLAELFGGLYSEATAVPSTLTKVELVGERLKNNALFECQSVTEIILSSTITEIGNSAFRSTGISSIELPAGLKSIGEYALAYCPGVKSVVIPKGVEQIGAGVLFGMPNLESVEMPFLGTNSSEAYVMASFISASSNYNSVPTKLTTLKLSNVSTLGNSYLVSDYITTLIIEGTVTEIPANFCSNMDALSSVTLPNTVTTIGESAFSGCSRLTSITIPASVTDIDEYAFRYINLASVKFENVNGWQANGQSMALSETDFAANATLLKDNVAYAWKRTA